MVSVYGANWCEDTRRSLRHLRRLGVAHRYVNIDEDLDALARAKALNDGGRRTPTIDLGIRAGDLVQVKTQAEFVALEHVGVEIQ